MNPIDILATALGLAADVVREAIAANKLELRQAPAEDVTTAMHEARLALLAKSATGPVVPGQPAPYSMHTTDPRTIPLGHPCHAPAHVVRDEHGDKMRTVSCVLDRDHVGEHVSVLGDRWS